MHCQKSLHGSGTVWNGFPSKQGCKINWQNKSIFSIKHMYNNLTNVVKMIRNKANSFSFIWKTAASGYIWQVLTTKNPKWGYDCKRGCWQVQWWFSCCSVLKTLLYLCHDVVSTFFRATTDTGKRQDAFFRTRNCVLKHTYGVSSGVAIVFLSIYMGFIPSWKQAHHQSLCLFCSFQTVLSRFILELQIVAWKR